MYLVLSRWFQVERVWWRSQQRLNIKDWSVAQLLPQWHPATYIYTDGHCLFAVQVASIWACCCCQDNLQSWSLPCSTPPVPGTHAHAHACACAHAHARSRAYPTPQLVCAFFHKCCYSCRQFLQWQYCCHTHAHGHASVSSCSCRSAAETSVLVCRSCKAAALQVPDAQYIMLCFCLCLCRCLCLCALPAHSCALIAAGRQVAQFV